jgi:hypothetical protein
LWWKLCQRREAARNRVDCDKVLYADANPIGTISAWLNTEDGWADEWIQRGASRKRRELVRLQPNAMSETVVIHPVDPDHSGTGGSVACTPRWELIPVFQCPREERNCSGLTTRHTRMERKIGIARRLDKERSRHVGAVASNLCTKVKEDHLAPAKRALTRITVRQCGVTASQGSNIKSNRLSTTFAHCSFKRPCERDFSRAGLYLRQHLGEGTVGDSARGGNSLDLCWLLHRTEGGTPPSRSHQFHVRRRRRNTLPNRMPHGLRVERESLHTVGNEPGTDRRARIASVLNWRGTWGFITSLNDVT